MTPKKLLKYVVIAVVACNLVIIAVVLLGSKSEPSEPMPNPNGYDDFVRAGKMIPGRAVDYYLTNSQGALADFVSKNEEALKLVRAGLSRKCRVPRDFTADYMGKLAVDLPMFRQLGYSLCAEGKLAEIQSHTNNAVESYLDGIKFSEAFSRGGVIMVKLVGIASEYEPRMRLKVLMGSLDAKHCRDVAQKLDVLNEEEEPAERVLKEEKAWVRSLSWRDQLLGIFEYKQVREFRSDLVKKYQANRLQRIQLTVSFAERAYELEKGKKPQNLQELVPEYLKSVPIDPITGTNIASIP